MASMETQGQRHDRIGILQPPSEHEHPPAPNYVPPRSDKDVEITAVQRMISATIGSVLTSLLGKSCIACQPVHALMIVGSHTTRCRSRSITGANNTSPAAKRRPCCAIPPTPAKLGRHSMLSRGLLGAEPIAVLCRFAYWHHRECF